MCWWLCIGENADTLAKTTTSEVTLETKTAGAASEDGCPPRKGGGMMTIQRRPSKTIEGKVPHIQCTVTDVNLKYKFSYNALGKGATSVVRVAQRKSDGHRFAVKVVTISSLKKKELQKLMREVEIMKTLDHPNIVKLLEVYQTPYRLFLVMELCTGGELYDALASRGCYTEYDTAKLVEMMLSAIRYCHSKDIVHRDLKLENFVFESPKSTRLKLIDFGLSSAQVSASFRKKKKRVAPAPRDTPKSKAEIARNKLASPSHAKVTRMTTFVGTVYYVAPEMFQGSYDEKVDVWSIGIICYMLLTGRPPYDGDTFSEIERLTRYRVRFHNDDEHVSKVARSFVEKLLDREPETRVDATQALSLPWITKRMHKERRKSGAATVPPMVAKSLATFAKVSGLKRTALLLMAHHIAGSDLERLREIFEAVDSDRSGRISLPELRTMLEKSGLLLNAKAEKEKSDKEDGDEDVVASSKTSIDAKDVAVDTAASSSRQSSTHAISSRDLGNIFDSLDHDQSGRIQFTQFMAAMISQNSISNEVVKTLFDRLDRDNSGRITVKDLVEILGREYAYADAKKMLDDADANGDGEISLEEFVRAMRAGGATVASFVSLYAICGCVNAPSSPPDREDNGNLPTSRLRLVQDSRGGDHSGDIENNNKVSRDGRTTSISSIRGRRGSLREESSTHLAAIDFEIVAANFCKNFRCYERTPTSLSDTSGNNTSKYFRCKRSSGKIGDVRDKWCPNPKLSAYSDPDAEPLLRIMRVPNRCTLPLHMFSCRRDFIKVLLAFNAHEGFLPVEIVDFPTHSERLVAVVRPITKSGSVRDCLHQHIDPLGRASEGRRPKHGGSTVATDVRPLHERDVRSYGYDVLLALIELRSHGIVHDRLSCGNVIVDVNGRATLTGIERVLMGCDVPEDAREFLARVTVNVSADVALYGRCLFEMATGIPMHEGRVGGPTEGFPPLLRDLLRVIFPGRPADPDSDDTSVTPRALLTHPFFANCILDERGHPVEGTYHEVLDFETHDSSRKILGAYRSYASYKSIERARPKRPRGYGPWTRHRHKHAGPDDKKYYWFRKTPEGGETVYKDPRRSTAASVRRSAAARNLANRPWKRAEIV
eukprot:g2422.t1